MARTRPMSGLARATSQSHFQLVYVWRFVVAMVETELLPSLPLLLLLL